jgi:hypothetical protein
MQSSDMFSVFLHVHVTRLHWLLLSDVCGRTSLLVSGDLMPSSTCKVHYCWILQRRFFKCPAVPAVHGSSSKVKETLLIHFLWRKKLIQLVMIVQAFTGTLTWSGTVLIWLIVAESVFLANHMFQRTRSLLARPGDLHVHEQLDEPVRKWLR